MQNVAIYARVSRDEQAGSDRYSLPTQISDCTDYCNDQGYTIVKIYREDESGLTFDGRPELQKLIQEGSTGLFDLIVCLCPDRLARGITSFTLTAGALDSVGIKYEFVQGGALDDSLESKLTLEIAAVISGYEAGKIRERSMRGRNGRAKAGKYLRGRVIPFGYTYTPKSTESVGELVICEEEAKIVCLIFSWYVYDGLGTVAISKKLTELGIKRRGVNNGKANQRLDTAWSSNTVAYMLKNETYCGKYHYGTRKTVGHKVKNGKRYSVTERRKEEAITIDVPAIIDRELWILAQERRIVNRKESPRNTKRFYLMRGHVRCSTCGTLFRAYTSLFKCADGTVKEYRYYQCRGQLRDRSYDGIHSPCYGNINADKVDLMAWCAIQDFLSNPDAIQAMIETKANENRELLTQKTQELQSITARLEAISQKMKRLTGYLVDGTLAREDYLEQKALLHTQDCELTLEKTKLTKQIEAITPDPTLGSRLKQYAEWFQTIQDFTEEQALKIVRDLDFTAEITRKEKGEFIIHFWGYTPDNADVLLSNVGYPKSTNHKQQIPFMIPIGF